MILFVVFITPTGISQINATFQGTAPSCPGNGGTLCCIAISGGIAPYECTITGPIGSFIYNPLTNCFLDVPSGSYSILITDNFGNSGVASGDVPQNTSTPITITATTTNATCGQTNGSACCTVAGGSGSYTYSWFRFSDNANIGNGLCQSGLDPNDSYSFIAYDANTPCFSIAQILVGETTLSVSSEVSNSNCVSPNCDGSAILSLTGTAPYSIAWTSGGLTNASYTTGPIPLTGLCHGTYTGTVTDANGCIANINFTINLEGADVIATNNIGSTTNTDYHIVNADVTWDPAYFSGQTTIVVTTNVIVKPGVTLTIEDLNVLVVPFKTIRAESTANIISNNSIFDAVCGTTWRGFEILAVGIHSAPNQRASLQSTDCEILHAECAIRNYSVGNTYNFNGGNAPNIPTSSGGRVFCLNTQFIDNVIDGNFQSYLPAAGSNNYSCLFENCKFSIQSIPTSETIVSTTVVNSFGRIFLRNTSDNRFINCDLINLNPSYENPERIIGLRTELANYKWSGSDVGNSWSPANYQSSITGFRRGIDSRGEGSLVDAVILGAEVNNTHFRCHQGISMQFRVSARIQNNLFENYNSTGFSHANISSGGGSNFNPMYGIRSAYYWKITDVPQPFYIAHNRIVNLISPSTSSGIYAIGLGDMTNFFVENRLEGLNVGINIADCNRSMPTLPATPMEGLHYECNTFINNVRDIYNTETNGGLNTTNHPAATRGTFSPQANFYENVPGESAGNDFTMSTNSVDTKDDINYLNISGLLWLHNYQYHPSEITNPTAEMTTAVHVPIVTDDDNDCGYEWRNFDFEFAEEMIEQSQQQIEAKKELLQAMTDNGDTEGLISSVLQSNYQNAWNLYQELLDISPALSQVVLIEAIKKEYDLPASLLAHILSQNPQASKNADVLGAIHDRTNTLDDYQLNEVLSGQSWFSLKEKLEHEIAAEQANIAHTQQDIIHYLAGQEGSLETILNLLQEDRSVPELKLKADLLFRSDQITEASELLSGLKDRHGIAHIDALSMETYIQLCTLKQAILSSGSFDLTPAQSELLYNVYNNDIGAQGSYANFLLHVLTGLSMDEQNEGEIKSSVSNNENFNSKDLKILRCFPNPTKGVMTVNIGIRRAENSKLLVRNNMGSIVYEDEVNEGQIERTLTLEQLPVGIYQLSLCAADGSLIDSVSFLKN